MKVFANKKMKQFIIILVTVIMLFNVIAPAPLVLQAQAAEIVDAGGGILTNVIGKFFYAVAWAFQQLLNLVVHIGSEFTGGSETVKEDVFVSTIVYNQLPIVDANIFNPETQNPLLQSGDGAGLSGIVKTWYSITRLMALAASLVILVYVAIKIILSSTGQSKAKYTELLKDWLLSLLLIFSLHYVLAAILFCSDEIVNFFKNIVNSGGAGFSYSQLQSEAGSWSNGMSALLYSIVWLAFLGTTFVFLILYIKRLILICFFIILSPIIVLLNTINKIRGKGADLLGDWLKQFLANVVMQPIDALLFTVVLSGISFCLTLEPKQPLVALAFLFGYFPLRSWVLKFLGQNPEQNSQDAARGMVAGKGFSAVGKVAAGVGTIASNVSKIPKLNKEKYEKVRDALDTTSRIANRVGTGVSRASEEKRNKTVGLSGSWENGTGDWSNSVYDKSTAVEAPSSYTNDNVSTQISSVRNGKKDKQIGNGRKALGIAGRAMGAAAPKLIGAGIGLSTMAVNVGAGNGMKGFKGAMNVTESVIKAPSKFIEENGGFKSTVATTAKYIKDRAANSYIMTGEHGGYQKQLEVQQAWENEYEYMQDRFIATATDEQMIEFSNASNKKEYIMDQTRQAVRSDARYSNALEVNNGNALKTDNYILLKQKASWKNGQKKSAANREVVINNSSEETVVHTNGNSRTIEVQEHGGTDTIVVHRNGNGGTIEVQEHGGNNTTVVHTNGNSRTIEVQEYGKNNTTVISENDSVVTETVNNIEETNINRELEDFVMDPKTEDLAYDLIETMGEGDPLYEQYNMVSDQADKRAIALQFLFARAKDNWNERDLTDIIRSKNHQELQKLLKK